MQHTKQATPILIFARPAPRRHQRMHRASRYPVGRVSRTPLALGDPILWARDFAIVGGVTSFLAPAIMMLLIRLPSARIAVPYLLTAGISGAATGALLGWLMPRLFGHRVRQAPIWLLLFGGLALGAAWGSVVGAVAGAPLGIYMQSLAPFVSAALAAIAGALQLGWLWLPYTRRVIRRRPTRPLVVAACIASAGLGLASMVLLGNFLSFVS